MGSSCFARGNIDNLRLIEDYIKENNADIELCGLRCGNNCTKGPNIVINGVEYHNVTQEELRKIPEKLNDE